MKKIVLLCFCFATKMAFAQGPLLDWTPAFLNDIQGGNVVITCNGAKGNTALLNFADTNNVYVHFGLITDSSTSSTNWRYVDTSWAANYPGNHCTYIGNSRWTFTMPGNLRTYFGMPYPAEKILKIAILFRDALGNTVQRNSDGSDMFVPVDAAGGLQLRFNQPPTEPRFNPWPEPIAVSLGQNLPVEAVTNNASTITLYLNGANIGTGSSITSLLATPTLTQACGNELIAVANDGTSAQADTLHFFINGGTIATAALPSGVKDGINYLPGDTSVTLVLYAPHKSSVLLMGSFNNWSASCNDVMQMTPDSLRWWTTVSGLTPGQIYKFQYLVNGTIVTTDPYCEMVLDPWNDATVPSSSFPNIPAYPAGQSGIVGTFQTAQTPYIWTATGYTRPDKKDLIVYELLLRDFEAKHNYGSIIDSLNYFKTLGINCIELMPINEFDGNESWGYNPDFFFAPDKYYGTKNDLKHLIDEAHKKGIAVVMDAVLNHVTGQSPLAKLYWNNSTNKPSADNPWLNEDAKHPFNVFNDFNHESNMTKYHVHRFIKHWLQEYKIDGFRWDLAKGFTQTNNPTNVGAWGNYDASRVAIWKNYYDSMQAASANSYCILEFFGSDQEESELGNYGMLVWDEENYQFGENAMGNSANSASVARTYYKNRTGYNNPSLISYIESHDKERIVYMDLQNGKTITGYNVKSLNTALKRQEALHATLLMIPGPKMIWQFGELGYDFSINTCEDLSINNNCRLAKKPIRWDYYAVPERKSIYNAIARMNKLRALKPNVFNGATLQASGTDLGNSLVKKLILNHADLKLVTVANFDVIAQTFNQVFPANGKWYNYMGVDSISVSGGSKSITLQPGDYKIYTNINLGSGASGPSSIFDTKANANFATMLYPNPATDKTNLIITVKIYSNAVITLVDATGRVLQTLYNGTLLSGDNQIEIQTNALANGIYFINCVVEGMNQVVPMQVNN
jgi:1,4-alpha-glucan branching enzyme